MLITEALAELKTLVKRVQKKEEFVKPYLTRLDGLKDPLEKDGTSPKVLEREFQAIRDLNKRIVELRIAIQKTNLQTNLTVEGVTQSIAEWLTWRKEVSAGEIRFNTTLRQAVLLARNQAQQRGSAVVPAGGEAKNPADIIVNVDEAGLAKQAEQLEITLGTLDGQLSLLNAITPVIGV